MAKSTNTKRRPAPPPAKKGGRAAAPAPAKRPGWVVPAAVAGVVALLFAVALVATRLGGDDSGGGAGAAVSQTRPVTVTGEPLPDLPQAGSDPAVGMVAPVVTGQSFDGSPVRIGGAGRPGMVFFVAHWCPHCQREVPLLAPELERITPPGVEVVTVATSTREGAANYPPSKWLAEESWPTPVLADDGNARAADAYGLTGFPYFVLLDGEGRVVSRGSGGKGVAEVEALLKQVAPGGGG